MARPTQGLGRREILPLPEHRGSASAAPGEALAGGVSGKATSQRFQSRGQRRRDARERPEALGEGTAVNSSGISVGEQTNHTSQQNTTSTGGKIQGDPDQASCTNRLKNPN